MSGGSSEFDRRPAAALDRRLADAVLEAERRAAGRELVAVLAPDQLDAGELRVGAAGLLGDGLQPRGVGGEHGDGDVDVAGAERLLPVLGAAVADVAQLGGAGRHALPELRREAVQRLLRHAERLQAVVGEGDGDPGAVRGLGRRAGPSRRAACSRRTSARPAARSSMRSSR